MKGKVTDNEFRNFVDSCLKINKSPGPDGHTNESVKTMSYAELEILRQWANEILATEGARVMTVEEMNGTIRLLHKGGVTDDKPQDWRPVVLLNCTNQLVMHILNARLRTIVEKAGILEPGQSGGRQGRSTDINLTKLEWVTREALTQNQRVYRVDVDFTNAFNAMSQAALWAVMRAYGIPDVDLLMSLYEHSTVRMAPNDPQCATITFDTGVAQGSALSPLLFLIFMNALLGLITDRGQKLRISHGLKCEVQLRKKRATQDMKHEESVGQFNLIGFVDDLSLFAQTLGGAQALLEAIQEFELWSGLKVNRKKTCAMVVERQSTIPHQVDGTLVYMGQEVTFLAPSTACRYLGVWGTPTGDMSSTKERIFKKTEEARDLLRHHPLTPEQAIDLFTSIGVGAFRYSAALVPWTKKELERLEAVWIQAYKWAWGLPRSTASDVFTLPVGMEYLRPTGVMAQELCRHLQRCLKHEDVARQLTLRDLSLACEQWACGSMRELTEEMQMWGWDSALHNKWARAAKCSQLLNLPIEMPGDTQEELRGTSWARATRELRRLRHRIEAVGGGKDQWEAGVWHMDREQWDLLWTGEQAFWRAVPHLLAAGYHTVEELLETRKQGTGRPYKIPRLMAAQEDERTQTMRLILSRGIRGIDERTRGLTQRWFDMVDWRSASVGNAKLGVSRSIEGYAKTVESEVSQQHPARTWVERQERKSREYQLGQPPTTHECGQHLLQIIRQPKQGADEEEGWREADPSRHPQQVCRGLAHLLSQATVDGEGARRLARQIGNRLPPGWGAVWKEKGCSELQGTLTDQLRLVVDYLRDMEVRCACCQGRQAGTCQRCQLRWCTICQQEKEKCDVCNGPIPLITDPGAGSAKSYAQRLQAKGMKSARVVSVNMHQLGESFVEKVTDVRRRITGNGETVAPGESLEFLAHIRGWQSEVRRQRRDKLLKLHDIGLRVALENAAGKDIFFIPEVHFAQETPKLEDDEGWWYQVRSIIWCRECRKCRVRKERAGFEENEWTKTRPAICTRCNGKSGARKAPSGMRKQRQKRVKSSPNLQARRPRAAHGKGVAIQDASSESDEDKAEGVDWGACQYGVKMSPAHPWYVGRGDDVCGGEVVYSIQEIRQLLSSQPDDMKRWLTTSQMGWALTREENEVVNQQDEREGKPVARQLAPMISAFIRAQWESGDLEDVEDERRRILEEAMELDHIWGIWEEEKGPINAPHNWIKQPSQRGNDMRHHVEVHSSHRVMEWESPSASLIEQDPDVVPDVDIAAQVGKDFFLDEKIPRHESGQGYVRVLEHSVMWKDTAASKIFTYQGLTTCTEVDNGWTVKSSTYNHLRQESKRSISELKAFIRKEGEQQEHLEARGYRSPTWRLLRALQSLFSAVQLQGESAVTAPPFFPSAGRGATKFWGEEQGPTVFLWESLGDKEREECEKAIRERKDWVVWSRARPKKGDCTLRGFEHVGRAIFCGKVNKGRQGGGVLATDEETENDTADDNAEGGGRACKQKGWWKRGDVEANLNTVNMTAWVHQECDTIVADALAKLQAAWNSSEQKDECIVCLNDLERAYWMGTEIGQLGGYRFQGVTLGVDGSCKDGKMGSGCHKFNEEGEDKCARVGREEEGTSSNRPELGGVVLALRSAALSDDALLLCDNEAVLRVIKKWVGQGGKATLATAPDADILREIVCLLTQRVRAGRATFLVKVKSHRGEPINERADTLAEEGRTLSEEEKRWDDRTDRMTFEVRKGDTTVSSVWTNSVRNAFRKQAGWAKLQEARAAAAQHWTERVWYRHNQRWLQASQDGQEAAKRGSFKNDQEWGKKCFEDLDQRSMGRPATRTWSTDFLLREGLSREEIGKWLKNKSIPWQRRRRLLQVVTGTFPCGQQMVKYGYKGKAECTLCRKAHEESGSRWNGELPKETIGHIQSAGCLGQKEVVTAAHNACIRELLQEIAAHGKKDRHMKLLTVETESRLGTLWDQEQCTQLCSKEELWEAAKEEEMKIPWKNANEESPVSEEQYQERFWRRRLDGIGLDTVNKEFLAIEFKRTQDARSNYMERATAVAQEQYTSLLTGLQAVGQVKGWKVRQIVFVGGTCGSVHVGSFNTNMKTLGVLESKWDPIRQKLVRRLLEEQDKVLRSYFAQKGGASKGVHGKGREHVKWDMYA